MLRIPVSVVSLTLTGASVIAQTTSDLIAEPPAIAKSGGYIGDWWWVLLLVILLVAVAWYFLRKRNSNAGT